VPKKTQTTTDTPAKKRADPALKRKAAQDSEDRTVSMLQTSTRRGGFSGSGRAIDPVPGSPTSSPQPTDKSYKTGTYRVHWKGNRDDHDRTSGNEPFIGSRDSKSWTTSHDSLRKDFSDHLKSTDPSMQNPFGQHFAENSHLHAGSLFGPNDVLSAPPASIHQNTEWLAIEGGIKHLQETNPGNVRIKSTGYVHDKGELRGTLKAARYKVYVDGNKVFDHVTTGARGNIDKDEYHQLKGRVKALTGTSPQVSLNGTVPKGTHGTAPTLQEARQGQRDGFSKTHPQFTDLQHGRGTSEKTLSGVSAMNYATRKTKR
jgi:hypothetical protein